jgi:hypothetical protein
MPLDDKGRIEVRASRRWNCLLVLCPRRPFLAPTSWSAAVLRRFRWVASEAKRLCAVGGGREGGASSARTPRCFAHFGVDHRTSRSVWSAVPRGTAFGSGDVSPVEQRGLSRCLAQRKAPARAGALHTLRAVRSGAQCPAKRLGGRRLSPAPHTQVKSRSDAMKVAVGLIPRTGIRPRSLRRGATPEAFKRRSATRYQTPVLLRGLKSTATFARSLRDARGKRLRHVEGWRTARRQARCGRAAAQDTTVLKAS